MSEERKEKRRERIKKKKADKSKGKNFAVKKEKKSWH